MIAIRRLEEEDAAAYREIRLAALTLDPDALGSDLATEAAWPMERFAERVRGAVVIGAFAAERIVAMAGMYVPQGPKTGHKGVVWGVFVHPDCRGQGLGMALMQAVIQTASAMVEHLILDAVTSNPQAIRLYERCGFTIYGVERRALKAGGRYFDTVLMQRGLEAET